MMSVLDHNYANQPLPVLRNIYILTNHKATIAATN